MFKDGVGLDLRFILRVKLLNAVASPEYVARINESLGRLSGRLKLG